MLDTKKEVKPKKSKQNEPPTKVVIRHLPPNLTEDEFLQVIAPIPENNYFTFCPAEKSVLGHCFSRAYINFTNPADIYSFKDQFDGYVFVDKDGNESSALVEYAPFQKCFAREENPKLKDKRCGTIEADEDFLSFLASLENPKPVTLPGTDKMLEEIVKNEALLKEQDAKKTPLVEYIEDRNAERRRPSEFMSERIQRREDRKQRKLDRLKKRHDERKLRQERRRTLNKSYYDEDKEVVEIRRSKNDKPDYIKRAHEKYEIILKESFYDKRARRTLRRTLERQEKKNEDERMHREETKSLMDERRQKYSTKDSYKSDAGIEVDSNISSSFNKDEDNSSSSDEYERQSNRNYKPEIKSTKRYSVLKRDAARKLSSVTENRKYSRDYVTERKAVITISLNKNKEQIVHELKENELLEVKENYEKDEETDVEISNITESIENISESGNKDISESSKYDTTGNTIQANDSSKHDIFVSSKQCISESSEQDNTASSNQDTYESSIYDTTGKTNETNDSMRLDSSKYGDESLKKSSNLDVSETKSRFDVKEEEGILKEHSSRGYTKSTNDPRMERKIRNKDRPTMQLYTPGQSRLNRISSKPDDKNPSKSSTKSTSADNSTNTGSSRSNSSTPSPYLTEDDNINTALSASVDYNKKSYDAKDSLSTSKEDSNRGAGRTRLLHDDLKQKYENAHRSGNTATKKYSDRNNRQSKGSKQYEKDDRALNTGGNNSRSSSNGGGSKRSTGTSFRGARSFTNKKYANESSFKMNYDSDNSSSKEDENNSVTAKTQGKRYSRNRTSIAEKPKSFDQYDDE